MGYKKLISPEFRIGTEKYEITSGMEVECFSSKEARSDWCKVELTTQLQDILTYEDMEKATVELGYDEDYDMLLSGYCRRTTSDYWKEIMIRDAMIKLERIIVKGTFIDCTPQDVIRYVLVQAGITDYRLSDSEYGKKDTFIVNKQNGIKTITQVNSMWGIDNNFFFQDEVFSGGANPDRKMFTFWKKAKTYYPLKSMGNCMR